MKTFYRVANREGDEGLWYDKEGNFTGLIHNEYDFCANSNLEMPFDEDVQGWLSTADSMDELFKWFPLKDIIRLQDYGYAIVVYEATDYRKYENHWLIDQNTSKKRYTMMVDDNHFIW